MSPRSIQPVIASSLAAILRMNGLSARFFNCPLEALAAARSESRAREHHLSEAGDCSIDDFLSGAPGPWLRDDYPRGYSSFQPLQGASRESPMEGLS